MNLLFSLKQIRGKFFAMSTREQLLVVLVVGVSIYFLFENILFTPQTIRNAELVAARTLVDKQVAAVRIEILNVSKPNYELERAQLENAQLKKQMANLNAVSTSIEAGTPEVDDLLKRVLQDFPKVTLVSLKTLPVTTLIAATQLNRDEPSKPVVVQRPLYKHGVEVEIRSSYLDHLAYLKKLEASAKNVFWSDIKLLTLKYPETTLRVTIFILTDQPVLKIS